MAESEEELKSLSMRMKEESEKSGLNAKERETILTPKGKEKVKVNRDPLFQIMEFMSRELQTLENPIVAD